MEGIRLFVPATIRLDSETVNEHEISVESKGLAGNVDKIPEQQLNLEKLKNDLELIPLILSEKQEVLSEASNGYDKYKELTL